MTQGWIVIKLSLCLAIGISIWGVVYPIIQLATSLDDGTFTFLFASKLLLMFLVREFIAILIACGGLLLGTGIIASVNKI